NNIFRKMAKRSRCQCPQGWRENEDKCYYFSADTKSWSDANTFCSEQGSDLLSIRDIHERLWVRTQISTEVYWIGLNDRSREGVWEWSDGSGDPNIVWCFRAWIPGQPDNWGDAPGEDCGQVVGSNSGQWNDENCDIENKFICNGGLRMFEGWN
uniref:C-type lectin domain-containing protein n=1 Tax=Mola mola TaxID=94237 RepID=A0A3Q3VNU8_MOLML